MDTLAIVSLLAVILLVPITLLILLIKANRNPENKKLRKFLDWFLAACGWLLILSFLPDEWLKIETLYILVIITVFYFLPSIRAYKVNKHNKSAILVFNLIFGWTIVGWGLALVWSFVQDPTSSSATK